MSLEPSSYLRSEVMSLIQLYIPSELGHACIAEIGRLGMIEFRDLNPEVNQFQRAYTHLLKQLDDMERKLLFLLDQARLLHLQPAEANPDYLQGKKSTKELDILENRLSEYQEHLQQMNQSLEKLLIKQVELIEHKHVLHHAAKFFEGIEEKQQDKILPALEAAAAINRPPNGAGVSVYPATSFDSNITSGISSRPVLSLNEDMEGGDTGDPLLQHNRTRFSTLNLGFVAGIISRNSAMTLRNVLWRALRGNLFIEMQEIQDLLVDISSPTLDKVAMNVFIVSAHGRLIMSKIRKLAESLGARLYPIDEQLDDQGFLQASAQIITRIEDVTSVLYNTQLAKTAELDKIKDWLKTWLLYVRREKLVHHTLNLCDYDANKKCLIAEGWTPRNAITELQDTLRLVGQRSQSSIVPILSEIPSSHMKPPTYHRTNKFTLPFQEIVDAYGVGAYREINPALFSLVTFPFFFAVMFGDFGHGAMLSLFAIFLCVREKQLMHVKAGEIWSMMFSARYVILLMGLFSIYVGLMYNDVFSRAFEIFPSAFTFYPNGTMSSFNSDYVCPFGIDSGWAGATNNLAFTNSYKMKQSILLGIFQMLFGIGLSGLNMVYFGDRFGLVGIFLPQMLFMLCIFGYLAIMIIYKWITQTPASPSLLTMLIQMILSPGTIKESDRFYPGQEMVQLFLVSVAVLCIPFMLLYKPLMVHRQRKQLERMRTHLPIVSPNPSLKRTRTSSVASSRHSVRSITSSVRKTRFGRVKTISIVGMGGDDKDYGGLSPIQEFGAGPPGSVMDDEYLFSDELVHSGIHTIEFILGAVSNTASYLRLWALSLAHSQLSEVLWSMLVEFCGISFVFAFFVFFIWLGLTISILILMEGLSAFLHALRLHWVEFNNKFYSASGFKFVPFSYAELNADYEDEACVETYPTSNLNMMSPLLQTSGSPLLRSPSMPIMAFQQPNQSDIFKGN